jgi:GNAT superfamily N-acetyltransferase
MRRVGRDSAGLATAAGAGFEAGAESGFAGARRSTAQDSRWFAPGRCTSQQLVVQKTSAVRFWLQVETLHAQKTAPSAMGFLQALQRRQAVGSSTGVLRRNGADPSEPREGWSVDGEIHLEEAPNPSDVARLEDEIYAFNSRTTGIHDGRMLAAFLRDDAGELRAGLTGHTWGGCCEVRFLWVREVDRHHGLGTRLLRAAEDEARRRGCRQVVLSTHSFQAPEFYRRHGYVEVGRAEGYPLGHAQIYLTKALLRPPGAADA